MQKAAWPDFATSPNRYLPRSSPWMSGKSSRSRLPSVSMNPQDTPSERWREGDSGSVTIGDTVTLEQLERDPYPAYAQLRDEEPVSFVPAVGLWLVTRHDDVKHVAMHPETFTAATEPSTLNRTMGRNMLGMEGPEQQWIRAITEAPFRPRDVEERTQGMIPRLAGELIDSFADRGRGRPVPRVRRPDERALALLHARARRGAWQDILRWNEGLMPGLANFEGDPAKQAPADEAAAALHEAIGEVLDRLVERARRLGAVVDAASHRRRPPHEPRADRRRTRP